MHIADPLVSAGLVNAGLLALVAGAAATSDRRWGWLGAFLLTSCIALFAILVQHRTEGRAEALAVSAEQISWLSGPLLYLFVSSVTARTPTAKRAAAHLVFPTLVWLGSTIAIVLRGAEPPPSWSLVAFQLCYTILAAMALIRRSNQETRTALEFWAPSCATAAMIGTHVAQTSRLTRWGTAHPDMVPIVASIAILVAIPALLLLPKARLAGRRYAKSGLKPGEAAGLFERARAELLNRKLFVQPQLTLGDVASAIAVPPHKLTQAISDGGGTSFGELVTSMRVEEAKRLLALPENAVVSIEPIGMEAGFRSRSAFYAAFRTRVGCTPAEFRTSLSAPAGTDSIPQERNAPDS